jgi:glucose-6-phosphate 1-epimerase
MGKLSNPSLSRPSEGVVVTRGRGGMPKLVLVHASGGTAELYLHGAHVTSWTTSEGEELLFVSDHSAWHPEREIRGGIPVVFPQFGPGPLPQHGFARTREWTLERSGVDAEGGAFAVLRLADDDEKRSLWPHAFLARLHVRLDEALRVGLEVTNPGNAILAFTAALHTYFRIAKLSALRIEGLRGVGFRDGAVHAEERTDTEGQIRIAGEVNRVYVAAPPVIRIHDGGSGRTVVLHKQGFADAVVWNPWTEWSRSKADFGDDEYLRMVCVEAAQVAEPIHLAPGEAWRAEQTLSVTTGP